MRTLCTARAAALAAGFLAAGMLASPLFAGNGTPRQMRVYLLNSGVQTEANGKLMVVTNKAQTFFHLSVSGMTPGEYDLLLDGVVVDTLTVNADGTGRIRHASHVNPNRNTGPLPYDPRGGEIEIMATGVVLLTANVPSDPAQAARKSQIHIELTNMAVQPTASAEGTLVSKNGRLRFNVQLEGALPGTYDLMVDGVKVGEIVVDASGFGEIQFDSRLSDDDELSELLTFDPRGAMISVVQLGVTVFSEPFPEQ